MDSAEMDQKFQDGLKLWDAGNLDEGAEVWSDLAKLGHLKSIEKIAQVFLDLNEFEIVERYLNFASDQSNPSIGTLRTDAAKAREIENLRIESAADPNTSLEILNTLSKDKSIYVRHTVAANPTANLQLLETLSEDQRAFVREAVAGNPNTSLEILDKLAQDVSFFVQEEVARVRFELADDPLTDPKKLQVLARTEDLRDGKSTSNFRWRVAANPSTPLETLEILSRDEYFQVLWGVAENPSSSQSILERLAQEEDEYVRQYVAKNRSLAPLRLEELSRDDHENVRCGVAQNPSSSQRVLENLSKDSTEEVREAVAGNPNSNLDILSLLSRDKSYRVRLNVARNPNSDLNILSSLSKDEDSSVRNSAARNQVSKLKNTDEPDYSDISLDILEKKSNDRKALKAKKEYQYFSDAERYLKVERDEEAVDLYFELARAGHIESLEKLFEIFLEQEDFAIVEDILTEFPDRENPKFLFLEAKLLEVSNATDLDLYIKAASAGSLNAMLTLVEKYSLIDRAKAKKWLAKAEKIGFTDIRHFREMLEIKPLPKSYKIICVFSYQERQWLNFEVQRFEDGEYIADFDSLDSAIEFCKSEEAGFEVIQVNENLVKSYPTVGYRIKVIPDRNRITIAEGIHDYWFGDENDIEAAVEEVSDRDCDWELVYYAELEQELYSSGTNDDFFEDEDEVQEITICSNYVNNTRFSTGSHINPDISGLKTFLISFEQNSSDGFLNINYESSFEDLWLTCDPKDPKTFLKGVIHLALILGYGRTGYHHSRSHIDLPDDFPSNASDWKDLALTNWVSSISQESDLDNYFIDALMFLTEYAYEEDPGWTYIVNGAGLRMSSIWTEDSDIWGDRYFREKLPAVDIHSLREMWGMGEIGGDTSFKDFQGNNPISYFEEDDENLEDDEDQWELLSHKPEVVESPTWGSFRKFWTDCELTITPNLSGFIDIEGGSVGISGKWFETCSSCYSKTSCSDCGRNATNSFQLRAGNGDGIYTVFEISFEEKAVGALLILDDIGYAPAIMERIASTNSTIDDDPDALAEFYKEFYKDFYKSIGEFDQSLPMHYLGDIRVDENPIYTKGDDPAGILIFGESGEGKDSIHSLVTLNNIVPGNFRSFVFAHRNEENENILVPRFVLILEENSANQIGLTEVFANGISLKDEYELWSKSTVFARIGEPLAPYVISGNVDWCNLRFARELRVEDYETARDMRMEWLSWLLLLQSHIPSTEINELIQEVASKIDIPISTLHIARGQFQKDLMGGGNK